MHENPESHRTRGPEPRRSERHDVGAEGEVAEGELVKRVVAGREIGIARIGGRLHAASLRCTHAAWLMDDVPLEGTEIVCALHGARFDLRDGGVIAGPARGPLETFAVHVRDGRIEIEVPELRSPRPRRDAERC